MALTYQNDILTTLAYLMGERTVNSTTSTQRADFIQQTLNELYAAFPWRFARTNTTLTLSSNIATLPTNYDFRHELHAYYLNSTSNAITLNEIAPADSDKVADGDLAFWLDSQSDGTFLLKSKDTITNPLYIAYQKLPPTLDTANTVGTPYPNKQTLALGARRFVKLGQNPDADISQDQALFEKYRDQDIAASQVPHARKRRNSRQSLTGRSTGDF